MLELGGRVACKLEEANGRKHTTALIIRNVDQKNAFYSYFSHYIKCVLVKFMFIYTYINKNKYICTIFNVIGFADILERIVIQY